MKESRDLAERVEWRRPLLEGEVAAAMQRAAGSGGVGSSDNSTGTAAPAAGGGAVDDAAFSDGTLPGAAAFCSAELATRCSAQASRAANATVALALGEEARWADAAARFLGQDALFVRLADCAAAGPARCALSACYACYCGGLAAAAPRFAGDGGWLGAAKKQCAPYVDALDARGALVRAAISALVVAVNNALVLLLQLLASFEKHWTKSDRERSYAVAAFVSQLLNSVVVLLLVNARAGRASEAINSGLSSAAGGRAGWLRNVVLAGSYSDFTPAWYENVGVSIFLIAAFSVAAPPASALAFWALRKLRQRCLADCVGVASQSAYDAAWAGDDFCLGARVGGQLVNLWLILQFGSGMPLLYAVGVAWLAVAELLDRHALARLCQRPTRYRARLPNLLIGERMAAAARDLWRARPCGS